MYIVKITMRSICQKHLINYRHIFQIVDLSQSELVLVKKFLQSLYKHHNCIVDVEQVNDAS